MILIFLFFFLIYITFSFLTLKKVFEGNSIYLLYYVILFLPFYTFFQLIALKLSDQIIFVQLIRYSKDIIIFSSFFIYMFGFRENFKSLKFSFSVLDKFVIFRVPADVDSLPFDEKKIIKGRAIIIIKLIAFNKKEP